MQNIKQRKTKAGAGHLSIISGKHSHLQVLFTRDVPKMKLM
jgi:hypothetical protein